MASSTKHLAAVLLLALASAMIVTAQDSAQDMVDAHNAVRADVGVGPVAWDDTVAAYAQMNADKRRVDCSLVPSPEGRPYGENIFLGSGTDWVAADPLNLWASGKQYYDHATNTCSVPSGQSCAEYTQVVWSDTTAIGCGYVVCDDNVGVYVICNYSPPGNVAGQTPY